MIRPNDIRYQADGPTTAAADLILFPIAVSVQAANSQQALKEIKSVAAQLSDELARVDTGENRLQLCELAQSPHRQQTQLRIEVIAERKVQATLTVHVALTFKSAGDFWHRAETVAWCVDFFQHFCTRKREKHIIVYADRAKFPSKPEAQSTADGDQS